MEAVPLWPRRRGRERRDVPVLGYHLREGHQRLLGHNERTTAVQRGSEHALVLHHRDPLDVHCRLPELPLRELRHGAHVTPALALLPRYPPLGHRALR